VEEEDEADVVPLAEDEVDVVVEACDERSESQKGLG